MTQYSNLTVVNFAGGNLMFRKYDNIHGTQTNLKDLVNQLEGQGTLYQFVESLQKELQKIEEARIEHSPRT